MNIALCDDDGRFRAQTARSLENILETRGISAEVAKFGDAEELLAAIEDGATYDLYLLDIVMPGMDGVTLARRLRTKFPSVPLLFFTTSSDFAVEAFALGAAHYVVKPFTREQFELAIDRALAQMPRQPVVTSIAFKTSDGLVSVAFEDIVYSETDEHYQHVRRADGREFVARMSGQELWQNLEPTNLFVRTGLKYIFNLRHIAGIGKNRVTLTDGRVVEVPRRAMTGLKSAYLHYYCR